MSNAGTSPLSELFSTISKICWLIVRSSLSLRIAIVSFAVVSIAVVDFFDRVLSLGPQIGPLLFRALFALLFAPAGDLAVVAAHQHVGHAQAAILSRAGVLCEFQQAMFAREGILFVALFVSEHAGNQPRHGIDDHHRRYF